MISFDQSIGSIGENTLVEMSDAEFAQTKKKSQFISVGVIAGLACVVLFAYMYASTPLQVQKRHNASRPKRKAAHKTKARTASKAKRKDAQHAFAARLRRAYPNLESLSEAEYQRALRTV